jgi:hypothetical protein
MKFIGRVANFLVGIVEMILVGIGRVIGFAVGVISVVILANTFWPMIDGAHLGTASSIGGIAGLIFTAVMTLAWIGHLLDPFDFMNVGDTDEGAKKATRDDLRKAGLIGRR